MPPDTTNLQMPNISTESEVNNSFPASDIEHTSHQFHQNEIEFVGTTIPKICQQSQITNNSVEILRCMQKHLVHGRALDVQNPQEGGATPYVLVDRHQILETS